MSKLNKRKFIFPNLLFNLLLVFIFFDGIRSNLIFGSYLTIARELFVAILFLYVLSVKKERTNWGKILLWPFYVYHIFVCIMTFILPGYVQLSFVVKPFYLLIGTFLFYHYEEITHKSFNALFTSLAKIAVVFVVVDVFFYFVRIPLFRPDTEWWGRISCGYPTMDVISLAYSFCVLLFYKDLQIKDYKRTLYIIIVLCGMIIQFTGTGIVLIVLIVISSIAYYLKYHNLHSNNIFIYVVVALCLSSGTIISYVAKKYPQEYKNGYLLMENKIDILMGNETDVNTLEIRKEQYVAEQRKMLKMEKYIGKSLVNATNDGYALAHNPQAFMIEDQYNLNKICYGYIGFSLFFLMLFSMFFYFLRQQISVENKILLCLSVVIFALNSKTLISLVLFPNYMFFALFVGYGLKCSNFKNLKNDKTKRSFL